MDKYSNEAISKGASKIFFLAQENGMQCSRLTWNPNYKGVDDWQLAMRRNEALKKETESMDFKARYLSGLCGPEEMERYLENWRKEAKNDISPAEYLGLNAAEYEAYLQGGTAAGGKIPPGMR